MSSSRWRHYLAVSLAVTTLVLITAGGVVTSINAGLAVPDWPTSFGSWDPLAPLPAWWTIPPVLAEHGHRLLGALAGLLTVILVVSVWLGTASKGLRYTALAGLVLVIVQGILGGLRVVWISLDLAVVHACTAQLFFGFAVAMVTVTGSSWKTFSAPALPGNIPIKMRQYALALTGIVFLQLVLGALLRHPGDGLETTLVILHILGAAGVLGAVGVVGRIIGQHCTGKHPLGRHRLALYLLVGIQIALGISAYLLLLYDTGTGLTRTLQVFINTTHVTIGALLFGSTVSLTLWTFRESIRIPAYSGAG